MHLKMKGVAATEQIRRVKVNIALVYQMQNLTPKLSLQICALQ